MNLKVLLQCAIISLSVFKLCTVQSLHVFIDSQGSESAAPTVKEDPVPQYLTVRLTGIVRSREQALQSGGFAPSTVVIPFHQGFQLLFFALG